MQKEDILKLASLARIRIKDDEVEALLGDISAVLAYVSDVNTITADTSITKKVGARFNIFREDEIGADAGSYADALLAEAPKVKGRHLQVKKILQQD